MDNNIYFKRSTEINAIWSVPSPSDDFYEGITYGMFYGLNKLRAQRDYQLITYDDNGAPLMFDNDAYQEFFYNHGTTLENLRFRLQRQATGRTGQYSIGLRLQDKYYPMIFVSTDFLHGLFTALTMVNIPYDEVVLTKPVRNGVYYDIVGLQLPRII